MLLLLLLLLSRCRSAGRMHRAELLLSFRCTRPGAALRWGALLGAVQCLGVHGQTHGVEAVVNVQDVASDGGGQRGQQEGSHVADLNGGQLLLDGGVLVRVPAWWGW